VKGYAINYSLTRALRSHISVWVKTKKISICLAGLLGSAAGALFGGAGLVSSTGCLGQNACVDCGGTGVGVKCRVGLVWQDHCSASVNLAAIDCLEGGGNAWRDVGQCTYAAEGDTGALEMPADPSTAITYNSGVYYIDADFVDDIRADPNVLYFDGTRLTLNPTSGYFEVTTEGDLSDALGWYEGDVIVEVNGYDLASVTDVLDAFLALDTETEFEVDIDRATGPVTLYYEIQ
jgi:hypothetical protein